MLRFANERATTRMTSSPIGHTRWVLVFWLFVLSAIAFLDRVNISIAGSSIAADYGLTHGQLGYVFSSFLLGYALFQTVGGWLSDKLGPRRVLTAGVVWWGIFTALTAMVPSQMRSALLFFVAIRFLLGAGEAVIYPASNQFVSWWIPTQERGIANGIIFAGVGVGAGITPPAISYVMFHYGWRSSFWMSAIIGLAAGLVWLLMARDKPEDHSSVSPAELHFIQSGRTLSCSQSLPGSATPIQVNTVKSLPWSTILQSKSVWAVTFSYFCYGYVAWIFFSWFYIYLAKVRGLDLKASAFYATLPFLAMAVCCPLGGAVADRLTRWRGKRIGRCGIAVLAMGMTAVFLLLGSRVASARLASIVLAGGAGALYLSQSSFWSVSADIGAASSGSVSGFMNMGAQLGGAVTASLTPAVAARYGWTASFYVAAVLAALGALAWLAVNPDGSLAATQ
jgi:ACS family glucarate transporter-like MFS transporter